MFRLVAIAIIALLLGAGPSIAQLLPEQEGATTSSSSGTSPGGTSGGSGAARPASILGDGWRLKINCKDREITGMANFQSADRNDVAGHFYASSNGVESQITGGSLNGRQLNFVVTFHILGKRNDEAWTGRISADGNSIAGTFTGFWANDCRFAMNR